MINDEWRDDMKIKDKFPKQFNFMSENALMILWKRFSEIQHANFLIIDGDAIERFVKWIETGDDNEAWS
jgi:hypothetical protein